MHDTLHTCEKEKKKERKEWDYLFQQLKRTVLLSRILFTLFICRIFYKYPFRHRGL